MQNFRTRGGTLSGRKLNGSEGGKKRTNLLSGHRKGPWPLFGPKQNVYKQRFLFCPRPSIFNRTHKHRDITIYIFMYRYTILLYTTCTDGRYFCVHSCTLLNNLRLTTYTCGAHTKLGSVVLLYNHTVVQSLCTCTIEPLNVC